LHGKLHCRGFSRAWLTGDPEYWTEIAILICEPSYKRDLGTEEPLEANFVCSGNLVDPYTGIGVVKAV